MLLVQGLGGTRILLTCHGLESQASSLGLRFDLCKSLMSPYIRYIYKQ